MKASAILGMFLLVAICSGTMAEYHVAQGSHSVQEVGKVKPESTWEMKEVGKVDNGWTVVSVEPIDG
ncbi:hypothetical protein RRG08_006351 [Elysia crispata]|uniref:Uncharacterized protein n=1 Tax=Elysia crispata TaxID=231223 RepID=A0AAE0YRP1_9GAST|nr:hypothetical protein RRG08_006351 [Elysia crispata]